MIRRTATDPQTVVLMSLGRGLVSLLGAELFISDHKEMALTLVKIMANFIGINHRN